jgi:molecular chaperone DnaJ
MAARKDPYSVLGVDKKATAAEIKKAYRKLARQYHPDRNPDDAKAEGRFKEISEANDLLSDPEKRAAYRPRREPAWGASAAAANPFGGGFDGGGFSDILSNLFGGAGGRWRRRGAAGAPGPERGRDLEAEIQIGFDQAVHGAQVPLQIPCRSAARPARAAARGPAPSRPSARAAKVVAWNPRARACSRSPCPARAAAAAAP